jgi:hypothetical protein
VEKPRKTIDTTSDTTACLNLHFSLHSDELQDGGCAEAEHAVEARSSLRWVMLTEHMSPRCRDDDDLPG